MKFAKVMFLQVSVCPHQGGMHGCSGGHVWLLGGHALLLRGEGAGGVHGFIQGVCVVLFGGHAWFYLGGCMFFSVFSDTMRYGQ